MASAAQFTANIANARHSTGPVTTLGKARSASNATKFGFYSKQAVLLTDDDHMEFDALIEAYAIDLQPQTAIEETLFHQIGLAAWNLQRANCLEANLALTEGADPLLSTSKTIDRIHTFRNRTERSLLKLLNEFRQEKSGNPSPKPNLQNEPKIRAPLPSAPASYTRVSRPPYIRPEPKVGRNEPCPCKSGRKYKQCCLQNEPNSSDAPVQ